eukprot:NODE_2801_length_1037_cov_2.464575_g2342_i0.p3 GENE.NODE_2801_length_1037_cov_2.464575_g2342_i0~~NODE_2801_length_1037_cov_2.464575_g2342_i0.p3  ORF type:complete len:51 (-),score=0.22 NODE_2801_length_1037_cov_2.464575_g2342_i0:115-267(-)
MQFSCDRGPNASLGFVLSLSEQPGIPSEAETQVSSCTTPPLPPTAFNMRN